MTEGKNKRVAAALAAVSAYLQEEAATQQQSQKTMERFKPKTSFNVWGHSGRQDMMSLRQMIQLKAFSRL